MALLLTCATSEAATRRVALVVGNNQGSGSRPTLRYAEDDAAKMARALREVGEVAANDVVLLQGRTQQDVETAIAKVKRLIGDARLLPDTRTLLIFYFSGHGDGEALELGKERLTYAQLKALLAGTGAETRVVIVDACQSGSAILQKGGTRVDTFAVQLADRLRVSGEVFITSTASNEAALESSELMGSFFTHHVVSGLRGAADVSGDRRVTLSELYRYAYERTVATTSVTPAGTQHPSYKYALSGEGELVLAAPGRASAQLELPADAERVLITDAQQKQVVAEVLPGGARSIALAPGRYSVRTVRGGKSVAANVMVAAGVRQKLEWHPVNGTRVVLVASKGEETSAAKPSPLSEAGSAVTPGTSTEPPSGLPAPATSFAMPRPGTGSGLPPPRAEPPTVVAREPAPPRAEQQAVAFREPAPPLAEPSTVVAREPVPPRAEQQAVASREPAPPTTPSAAPSHSPKTGPLRLCVLPFKNLTGDAAVNYFGDAVAEAVATDIGYSSEVRLVERGQVDVQISWLELEQGRYVDPALRAGLGRIHGAEVVVLGAYQRAGHTTRATGRFVNVETGEVLASFKVERANAQLLALQDAVAAEVRQGLPRVRRQLRPGPTP